MGTIVKVLGGVLAAAMALVWTPAAALERLEFALGGGSDTLQDELLAASLLVTARREGETDPDALLAVARSDYARLLGVLYAAGRFGGVIEISIDGREAAEIAPLAAPDSIDTIRITVIAGPIYSFGRAEIAPLAPGTDLPEGFAPGERGETDVIRQAAETAVEAWRSVGHALADVGGQEITVTHPGTRVDARIALAPGPELSFGALTVTGNARMRESRIRQIAGVPVGERYSPEALRLSADRLRRTGIFRSVTITEAETPNPDGTLDIGLDVTEEKKRRYGLGAELSTTEGLGLSAFWLHRNLRGGGERLRIEGEVSGIGGDSGGVDYSVGFRLSRPGTLGPDTDGFITAELSRADEPEFTSDALRLGFGLTRVFGPHITTEAGLEFRFSSVEDASGTEEYTQLFVPLRFELDRREDLLSSDAGYYVETEVAPFLGIDGSESGIGAAADLRIYEAFGASERIVLAGRLQAGSLLSVSPTGLPNELRFTSGGGGTVRGQDYQSLDVELDGGQRSGGRSLLVLSGEVRARATENISLVGFLDWGIVGADSVPDGESDSHSGYGLGLRYDTGIGPIRLDLGLPLDGPEDGADFHIYIGIGQAF